MKEERQPFRCVVIGIDDNREQYFSPEIKSIIREHRTFCGGARHYEVVRPYLPEVHEWIYITVPLDEVFRQFRVVDDEVVVFASGDPLFFGFANTIQREIPDVEMQVFPYFNSLQLLAHRLLMPYQEMHVVSLTGRPWLKFDEALIIGYDMVGVLTDNRVHTPSVIAQRMLEYGYDNYEMYVGELLGNHDKEKVTKWRIEEVVGQDFDYPNNIILRRTAVHPRPFGVPESGFHLLNGRAKMITKMPIRLLSLSMLDLRERTVMWDVGFCTGSVSVEAKLQFPHLQIVAFEQREEGRALMHDNSRKWGTPGIETVVGDFTEVDATAYPSPDAVFIGGHSGKMHKIVTRVSEVIRPGGAVVFNSVSAESKALFSDAVTCCGFLLEQGIRIRIDDFNEIEVLKAVMPTSAIRD